MISLHADERDGLKETAARARAAQANRLQLCRQVFRRQLPAARARRAPFERVVRQKLDVRAQHALADPARRAPLRLRRDRRLAQEIGVDDTSVFVEDTAPPPPSAAAAAARPAPLGRRGSCARAGALMLLSRL